MWVKICGNTNLEDAARACELGADAVGFVFAESKRRVTALQVAAITPHLPNRVEKVGVFYSHDADEIAGMALEAGLDTVQLHGGLDEGLIENLAQRASGKLQIIQVLHWNVDQSILGSVAPGESPGHQLTSELKRVEAMQIVDRVLIDSRIGSAGGGTGVAYDWTAARVVFSSAPDGLKLIVAGGLDPRNVATAIAELNPWGVDVSSGVEACPGRKDPALVEAFLKSARG
jgi:phosphoribosylanthranilate isomerase